jgi:peptidase S41-like protein
MKLTSISVLVIIINQFINPVSSFSQVDNGNKNNQFTSQNRLEIIEKTNEIFLEYYPLPELSMKMVNYINEKYKKGEYDQFENVSDFTYQITKDLRSISNDDHIRVSP